MGVVKIYEFSRKKDQSKVVFSFCDLKCYKADIEMIKTSPI